MAKTDEVSIVEELSKAEEGNATVCSQHSHEDPTWCSSTAVNLTQKVSFLCPFPHEETLFQYHVTKESSNPGHVCAVPGPTQCCFLRNHGKLSLLFYFLLR